MNRVTGLLALSALLLLLAALLLLTGCQTAQPRKKNAEPHGRYYPKTTHHRRGRFI